GEPRGVCTAGPEHGDLTGDRRTRPDEEVAVQDGHARADTALERDTRPNDYDIAVDIRVGSERGVPVEDEVIVALDNGEEDADCGVGRGAVYREGLGMKRTAGKQPKRQQQAEVAQRHSDALEKVAQHLQPVLTRDGF